MSGAAPALDSAPPPPPVPPAALAALAALYQSLDIELSRRAPACRGCGECCRFERAGHVLYASRLERAFLLRYAPPAVPAHLSEMVGLGLRCPYQAGHSCMAREGRALGCRLHFCGWVPGSREEEFYEAWHGKLKRLHDEFGAAWEYRPLLPLDEESHVAGNDNS